MKLFELKVVEWTCNNCKLQMYIFGKFSQNEELISDLEPKKNKLTAELNDLLSMRHLIFKSS